MEHKREMKVYYVVYLCDECGEPIEHDGICLASHPPQFKHSCKNGHVKVFNWTYPRTAYMPVDA